MEFNISYQERTGSDDLFQIVNSSVRVDKISLYTSSRVITIKVDKDHPNEKFSYPNFFIRCVVISEKDGVKTNHGYFSKLALYTDRNTNRFGIISIENHYSVEDVKDYFKTKHKKDKEAMKVNVQLITPQDMVAQLRASLMSSAKSLFKGAKEW